MLNDFAAMMISSSGVVPFFKKFFIVYFFWYRRLSGYEQLKCPFACSHLQNLVEVLSNHWNDPKYNGCWSPD